MYGSRRPRSPSDSWTEMKDDETRESSLMAAPLNPPKRRCMEWDPRMGAEAPAVQGAPHLGSCQPLELSQEQKDSSMEILIVVLESGTVLELKLGEEVFILAPKTAALQLTLGSVVLLVVPEHVLRSPDGLQFPVEAQCLLPFVADITWEIHIQDGDIAAVRTELEPVLPAGEEEAAPPDLQPLMRPPGNHIGISPSLLTTPFSIPHHVVAVPQRYPLPPTPSPVRLSRSADFSFSLESLPSSSLKPLPPSPSPAPQTCPRVYRRSPSRARRCLFRK
ncbi:proline-rich protein 23D1-like [Carlito syrichta]|uniref:Proline-rich protein 23D1-like n=1 Tax=Carlito syrichta TaxID=1868482 RepID=A0A1U7TZY8_CARSF|nr:proline-rich protein 23D1-like [Carlito syrichta]